MRIASTLSTLLLSMIACQALAHQIWIEPDQGGFTVYFGEYGENLKEVSPGLLDRIPTPTVTSLNKTTGEADAVRKSKNGFALPGKPNANDIAVEILTYPVREKKQGSATLRNKWVAAARYAANYQTQVPGNTFDLVPNGAPGKFKVYFRGAPLAKAKVALIAPNGWQREAVSNDAGELELAPLWQGLYVLEARHEVNEAGQIGEDKFDSATFVTTLSFKNDQGPETPRPAPAKPNPPRPEK